MTAEELVEALHEAQQEVTGFIRERKANEIKIAQKPLDKYDITPKIFRRLDPVRLSRYE